MRRRSPTVGRAIAVSGLPLFAASPTAGCQPGNRVARFAVGWTRLATSPIRVQKPNRGQVDRRGAVTAKLSNQLRRGTVAIEYLDRARDRMRLDRFEEMIRQECDEVRFRRRRKAIARLEYCNHRRSPTTTGLDHRASLEFDACGATTGRILRAFPRPPGRQGDWRHQGQGTANRTAFADG